MAVEKIRGFVTDFLKHSDRHNVVTLYTRSHGRVALLVPAGNGRTARLRNASLQPLSLIEADINFNPQRELQFLGPFNRPRLWRNLYFDPVKSAVGLFTAEFLNSFLRQSPPDARLWDFIVLAIGRLDAARSREAANFPLAFLTEFLDYAGIRPDLSAWTPGAWFDLRAGTIRQLPPGHKDVVWPEETALLPKLLRINTCNSRAFRFARGQRQQVLAGLLKYYSIHFPGLAALKSPAILAEVFS